MTPQRFMTCWSIRNRELDSQSRRALSAWVTDTQHGLADSAVILSTCERVEAYSLGHPPLPPAPTAAIWRSGSCAVEHLVRVASGLDSRLIGETAIRGQIRIALDHAADQGTLETTMVRIFRSALRAGARVRAESGLDRISSSYASLAAQRAIEAGPRIGVVGVGALARATLLALRRTGDARLTVFGRHPQRVHDLAAHVYGDACSMEELTAKVHLFDSLVMCVASERPVIHDKTLRLVRHLRLIDLGMPANVDQSAQDRSGVEYFDLDALAYGVDSPRHRVEQAELLAAREIDQLVGMLSRSHLLPPPRPWIPRSTAAHWKVA